MTLTAIVQLILLLAVLGLVWYLVDRYIPMPPLMRRIICIVAVVALIVWLLQLVGINILGGLHR